MIAEKRITYELISKAYPNVKMKQIHKIANGYRQQIDCEILTEKEARKILEKKAKENK